MARAGCRASSRIFLYLGYVLMTVTVIHWAVASHDLEAVGRLTGDVGLVGLEAFGKPLLYTIFVVTLAGAFRGIGVTALAESPDPDPGPELGSPEHQPQSPNTQNPKPA